MNSGLFNQPGPDHGSSPAEKTCGFSTSSFFNQDPELFSVVKIWCQRDGCGTDAEAGCRAVHGFLGSKAVLHFRRSAGSP